MENKTKIALTVLGLAALIVPAVLLVVFSGRGTANGSESAPIDSSRQLRPEEIQNELNNTKPTPPLMSPTSLPSPLASPSPKPSPSNPPLEGTSSGGVN